MSAAIGLTNDDVIFSPLTPHIASRVDGVDLAQPMDDEMFGRLRRELADRSVLVFPKQTVTPEQQIAFSRRFGPLENHVLNQFCLDGHPEIFVVSNIVENGRHVGAYGGSKQYHSDLSYMAEPSMGSLFHCLECTEEGGETAFASMSAAFEALPADRQSWLESRDAVHDYVWNHQRRQGHRPPLTEAQKAKTPPVVHPAVRRHPENGRKALFISEIYTRTFVGEDEAESQALVTELMEFATRPEFVYVHKWTPGDLIIWDNRSSVHKAMPFDEEGTRRRMHRTTVRGEKPER